MSTPTQPMLSPQTRTEITDFVAAVEHELDDLPPDDVAELTGGLEADLIEAWAAEGTTPTQRFGSPSAYAAELRSAAGLSARGRRAPRFAVDLREISGRLRESLRTAPGGVPVLRTLDELQPAWWVIRALAVLALPVVVLGGGSSAGQILLGGSALFLLLWSMRWQAAGAAVGRRRLTLLAWNAAALVALLAVPSAFDQYSSSRMESQGWYDDGSAASTSLVLGDTTVTNLFAYDEEGRPITRFRLYDQYGDPVIIGQDDRAEYDDTLSTSYQLVPDTGDGPQQWNLFPLLRRVNEESGSLGPTERAPLPFGEVGPLPAGAKLPAASAATSQPDQAEDGQ